MSERNFTDDDITALGEAIAAAMAKGRTLEEDGAKDRKILEQFEEAKGRYERAKDEWNRLWEKHRPRRSAFAHGPLYEESVTRLDWAKHCPPWRFNEE